MELDKANVEKFFSSVNAVYRRSFRDQYINFVNGDGYLLDRQHIMEMYDLMKLLFPLVHSRVMGTVDIALGLATGYE